MLLKYYFYNIKNYKKNTTHIMKKGDNLIKKQNKKKNLKLNSQPNQIEE